MTLEESFNPCFSGCVSRIDSNGNYVNNSICFNPCFSGCVSRIIPTVAESLLVAPVSILVLVDVSLEYAES